MVTKLGQRPPWSPFRWRGGDTCSSVSSSSSALAMISVVAAEGGAPHAAAVGAAAPGAAGAASAADAGAGGSTRKTADAESPLPLKRNHMNCYIVIKHVVISMEISESMVAMSTLPRNATVLQHFVHLPCRLLLSKSNFRRWDEKLDCRRGD